MQLVVFSMFWSFLWLFFSFFVCVLFCIIYRPVINIKWSSCKHTHICWTKLTQRSVCVHFSSRRPEANSWSWIHSKNNVMIRSSWLKISIGNRNMENRKGAIVKIINEKSIFHVAYKSKKWIVRKQTTMWHFWCRFMLDTWLNIWLARLCVSSLL